MTIEVANPVDGLSPDDDEFKEEGAEYNFRELMDQVASARDIIFTVPADQVDALKSGLIVRKSKDNTKTKNAGLIPDNQVLAFIVYPAKDNDGKEIAGVMDVRVKLQNKKSVQILDIRIPDDNF